MDKLPRTKLNPTFKSSVQNPQHNSRDALTCKGKPVHHPHPPCNKKTWRFPINPGDRIALPRQFRELLLVDRLLVHIFKPWDAPSIAFRRCFWVWLTWFHHYRSPRLPETSYSCYGLYLQNAWLDISLCFQETSLEVPAIEKVSPKIAHHPRCEAVGDHHVKNLENWDVLHNGLFVCFETQWSKTLDSVTRWEQTFIQTSNGLDPRLQCW